MKFKYLMPVFIFFLINISFAEETSVYNSEFAENSKTYLFADSVRIRKDPDAAKSNVIDTLNIGYKITILTKSDQIMVIDGYKDYWYKVTYKKNGKDSIGYVWGGMLSLGYSAKGDLLFLIGIKKYNEKGGFTGECKLVKNNKLISSAAFEPHYISMGDDNGIYDYTVTTELSDSKGLAGLNSVLRINFIYGACGYPVGNIWIGHSTDKLYYIGKDTSIYEAGVFQVEEKYIFPADKNGTKNTVKLISESSEFDEKTEDYKLKDKQEKKFKWENNQLNEIK